MHLNRRYVMNVKNFLMHGWNAFRNRAPTSSEYNIGTCVSRPGTVRLRNGSERTILASIYNRIALDVASIDIRHVKLNAEGNYEDTEDSDLNNCLTLEANIDQTARAFFQEVVLTMISEGVCAVVPIDTTTNDEKTFGRHSAGRGGSGAGRNLPMARNHRQRDDQRRAVQPGGRRRDRVHQHSQPVWRI